MAIHRTVNDSRLGRFIQQIEYNSVSLVFTISDCVSKCKMILKRLLLIAILVNALIANAQITLSHNIGTIPIETGMPSCEYEEDWGRVFNLSDFGIASNEQFIIRSGQVGINKSYNGAFIEFQVFSIDGNFPESNPQFLGKSPAQLLPVIDSPEVIEIDFELPVVVPASVNRILVTVHKSVDFYNENSAEVEIAGTAEDTDISWYTGCRLNYTFTPTEDLEEPVPNANFFLNVTGDTFSILASPGSTTLTHNTCDDLIENEIYACSWGGIKWARTFQLSNFGIDNNEEFVVDSGQIGLYSVGTWDVNIQFNIYAIDSNFPSSFSEEDLIGSSQIVGIPYFGSHNPRIFDIDFEVPILIPSDVEMVLVEVFQLHSQSSGAVAFTAGTEGNNDLSWFKSDNGGCPPEQYTSTADMGRPDSNFYINVTGSAHNLTVPFDMYVSNNCMDFFKNFSLSNSMEVAAVNWDFGDPATGASNQSTEMNPSHDFSEDGYYTITAMVRSRSGELYKIQEEIYVQEPPFVYEINDFETCENSYGSGLGVFDLSDIESQILNGREGIEISYFGGDGVTLLSPLSNSFSNSIPYRETISVQLSYENQPCCYSETKFDLIVNPKPELLSLADLQQCEEDSDGFAVFDLEEVKSDITESSSNLEVHFYRKNGDRILPPLHSVLNMEPSQESITVELIDLVTNCRNETTFNLIVIPKPKAYELSTLIGCDENGDGISEFFDTSQVEQSVIGNQSGMEVSYFDLNGNPIQLSNPYTNKTPNIEHIIVRVSALDTQCFDETSLFLETSSKPLIQTLPTFYACDEGNGLGTFDTSDLEYQLVGSQSGLKISYTDLSGNSLPSPLPSVFQNSEPWRQSLNIRVENETNSSCFALTTIDFVVNELPDLNLESEYHLCDLEPSLELAISSSFSNIEWVFEDGTVVSNGNTAQIVNAGVYSVEISELNNGVLCVQSHTFELIRSVLPKIEEVNHSELSNTNEIELVVSGEGDFEYSVDGLRYQDSNLFTNLAGGIYTVYVKDKNGCGSDSKEVTILDYPRFFTPNDDGQNDYWQIYGIANYPKSIIHIFDRFGKLIQRLSSTDEGWDGYYNGVSMPSGDYWFTITLETSKEFKGHFSLIRGKP